MTTKKLNDFLNECLEHVPELFPWDLAEALEAGEDLYLLDVREAEEFALAHIPGSINVPRGLLETACDYGYEDTLPSLVQARAQAVIVICRSGNRSVLAARVMQWMGYQNVRSLKTGVRGWNDYEQPLQDLAGNAVDVDDAEELLASKVRADQLAPQ